MLLFWVKRKNKRYSNFQRVCGIVTLPEKEMAGIISGAGDSEVGMLAHNTRTDMVFRVRTVSKNSDGEYLMELYEMRGADGDRTALKMIFRNWVRLTRPVRDRVAAVSSILGTMILIGIAAAAGAAFFQIAMSQIDPAEQDYVEVERLEVTVFGPGARSAIVEMEVRTNSPGNLVVGGGLQIQTANSRLTDPDGNPVPPAMIRHLDTMSAISYRGMATLASPAWGGEYVTVTVEGDSAGTARPAMVRER